jgi:hypothetical protein
MIPCTISRVITYHYPVSWLLSILNGLASYLATQDPNSLVWSLMGWTE